MICDLLSLCNCCDSQIIPLLNVVLVACNNVDELLITNYDYVTDCIVKMSCIVEHCTALYVKIIYLSLVLAGGKCTALLVMGIVSILWYKGVSHFYPDFIRIEHVSISDMFYQSQ